MNRIGFFAASTFAIAVVLTGAAAPAHATSVGVYGTVGAGTASGDGWEDWGGGWTWDRDTRHAGAGFVLETPTGIFPLGYRLGIGWERIDIGGEGGEPESTVEGLVIDNDFTYALLAGPMSRFWVGPELRLGFFNGSLDNAPGGDKGFFAAGIGPVLGFDFALGPTAALSWKLGYLYTWYYADEDSSNGWYGRNHRSYDDSEMEEGHAYLSLALLFRLGAPPPAVPQPGGYPPAGRW